jgi:hypothetical protein
MILFERAVKAPLLRLGVGVGTIMEENALTQEEGVLHPVFGDLVVLGEFVFELKEEVNCEQGIVDIGAHGPMNSRS